MSCTEQTLLSETYLRKLLPREHFQIGDFFIDISGLKAQMHFQIVDVSFYWQGYQKGFFPVKLDLLFSPSPFLQCDWWSSQWGRGESRGSQKGWGMMFDAPCIYQISKFAIINLNLLCFFLAQMEAFGIWTCRKRFQAKERRNHPELKRNSRPDIHQNVTIYFVQFDNQTTVIMM